jgi:hypothetical protein
MHRNAMFGLGLVAIALIATSPATPRAQTEADDETKGS